jgi:peptidyl-prolyl cis-trans isomerase D
MTEEVNDLLASGATLEELAQETDLELGQIEFHDEADGDIAGYAAFRQAAEAVKEGDFPEAVGLDDGGIFALRLDQVIAPRLTPLAEVREQVAADWKAAEIRSALNALADELIPRIEAGEPPESFGIAVNTETALTRDAFLADVPEGLVAKAFELAPGKAARIDGTPGTPAVAIVSTTEVLPPDPDNTDLATARPQYAERMDDELAGDLLEAMTEAIQGRAGIALDAAAINAVNAQFQ